MIESYEPGLRITFGDQVARRAAHHAPTDPYGPVVTGELRDESQVVMSPRMGNLYRVSAPSTGYKHFHHQTPNQRVAPVIPGRTTTGLKSQWSADHG